MTIDEVKSVFTVAGIPFTSIWELLNQYWGKNDITGSWWLVKTPKGLIRIGERKRVIEIDWSDTNVRLVATDDKVTKDDYYVHAWSILKATEYLKTIWLKIDSTAPLTTPYDPMLKMDLTNRQEPTKTIPVVFYRVIQQLIKYPSPLICRHYVALSILSELERTGYPPDKPLIMALAKNSEGDTEALKILKEKF